MAEIIPIRRKNLSNQSINIIYHLVLVNYRRVFRSLLQGHNQVKIKAKKIAYTIDQTLSKNSSKIHCL